MNPIKVILLPVLLYLLQVVRLFTAKVFLKVWIKLFFHLSGIFVGLRGTQDGGGLFL